MQARVVTEKLSDGSKVYSVVIKVTDTNGDDITVKLNAFNDRTAEKMAEFIDTYDYVTSAEVI